MSSPRTCGPCPAAPGPRTGPCPQGPRDAPVIPPHYLVGAGAVAEAYLAALATSATRAQIAVLDDDFISDKNLNRHLLARARPILSIPRRRWPPGALTGPP